MTTFPSLALCAVALLTTDAGQPAAGNLVPRQTIQRKEIAAWRFTDPTDAWQAEHECRAAVEQGVLRIDSTGGDPYLHAPVDLPGGQLALEIRMRGKAGGGGAVYWTTDQSPQRDEAKAVHFSQTSDGQWHDYCVVFSAAGRLKDLRLDPCSAPGEVEVASMRLLEMELHPLSIERLQASPKRVAAEVKNHSDRTLRFTCGGKPYSIDARSTLTVEQSIQADRPLTVAALEIQAEGLPMLQHNVFVLSNDAPGPFLAVPQTDAPSKAGDWPTVLVAADGSMAKILRGEQIVAMIAPLVHYQGQVPAMKARISAGAALLEGEGIALRLVLHGEELVVSLRSARQCEGPVVRAFGPLETGLFAGLEYLGSGEPSSSTADIETEEHLRFRPEVMKVTWPLMSVVTDRASVAMVYQSAEEGAPLGSAAWPKILSGKEMALQPVFATPNCFDGAADHRMALEGKNIEAVVHIGRLSIEETILWAVKKIGLPPLPQPPRDWPEQKELCLAALRGPLKTADGWGHCVEPHWPRQPFADHASTLWRLTGETPQLASLAPGGAHVANDSIFFATGRAQQWLDWQAGRAAGLLQRQQPDGSYRYEGKYRKGHFEDTASGYCALPAMQLLEYARLAGDKAALEGGLRTLAYMKRFRVPRGAQTWELSLHTPDQLASAYAVMAYVAAYELTGDQEHLKEARRWALSGLPFVYLWQCEPVMVYGTPPVFGATNWSAPNWIGLPVQWVGGVYGYALTRLAAHDQTLDWRHIARGILNTAEQMQYPDGPHKGLLPDSFELASQTRRPWDINPCAVVSLRLVLDGRLDSLATVFDGKHRITAPFPLELRDGKAVVHGKQGVKYQVLIDGKRILDISSQGDDTLKLDP